MYIVLGGGGMLRQKRIWHRVISYFYIPYFLYTEKRRTAWMSIPPKLRGIKCVHIHTQAYFEIAGISGSP